MSGTPDDLRERVERLREELGCEADGAAGRGNPEYVQGMLRVLHQIDRVLAALSPQGATTTEQTGLAMRAKALLERLAAFPWEYDGTGVVFSGRAHVAYISNHQSGQRGKWTAEFIAASPQLVLDLVAALTAADSRLTTAQDEIADLRAKLAAHDLAWKDQRAAVDALEAEIARLDELLNGRDRTVHTIFAEADAQHAETPEP